MRILYLLQDFPYPPTEGIRWKMYNLLNYMAQQHQCDVLSFGPPDALKRAQEWQRSLPGLRVLGVFPQPTGLSLAARRIWHIIQGHPLSLARWDNPRFATAIREAVHQNHYDLVHCDILNLAQYWPHFCHLPCVLSAHDAISMRYWRMAHTAENLFNKAVFSLVAWRLGSFEASVIPRFTVVHVVSSVDANYLLERDPTWNVKVIEIATDKRFLEIPSFPESSRRQDQQPSVLFSAGALRIRYIADPLLQFVETGFQQICRSYPDIQFVVMGRDAPKYATERLRSEPQINLLPEVDIEEYIQRLAQADIVLFLDSAGSGIKYRVIHALAAGKAVLGTPVVFEGIPVEDGVHACICNCLTEVTKTLLTLLQEPDTRKRLGRAARELVQQRFTEEALGRRWEALYEQAIAEHRSH